MIDIRGGPFHTAILTSFGRLFYSGNFYRSDSLIKDECTSEFIVLNTSTIGKVRGVRSSLTGICIMTTNCELYMLGHFGAHVFDEPF